MIFIVISLANKEAGQSGYDVINCVSFLTTSILMGFHVQKLRIQQMLYTQRVETERDTDGLTKLLTKEAGQTQIERIMRMETRQPGALVIFDLDNFKEINDTYGHELGDVILSEVGRMLRKSFRTQDVMMRFGGDEFVVFMSGVTGSEPIEWRARRIREQMAEVTKKLPGMDRISCSFGVAFFPDDGTSYDELFEHADAALYDAKRDGKDQLKFY